MNKFKETLFARQFANKGLILEGGPQAVLVKLNEIENILEFEWRASDAMQFNVPCWMTLVGYKYAKKPERTDESLHFSVNPYHPWSSAFQNLSEKLF